MRAALISLFMCCSQLIAYDGDGVQLSTQVTEVAPQLIVISTPAGNIVASVGPEGAFLAGTPSALSTPGISSILASRTKSRARYVVIGPEDAAHSEGDAGWQRRGAFVAMQENALGRLGGHRMGPPLPAPARLTKLGVERPRLSFSEVLSVDINGEAIHVVHQPPAYSNADCIVHFHVANLVYLGEVFPGDGYPMVDKLQVGDVNGFINILNAWTDEKVHIVPARGAVTNGAEVKAFRDMLATVRDRVQRMIAKGETENQVVAGHPTADFDEKWGHGAVRPDAFVRIVYAALSHPQDRSQPQPK